MNKTEDGAIVLSKPRIENVLSFETIVIELNRVYDESVYNQN